MCIYVILTGRRRDHHPTNLWLKSRSHGINCGAPLLTQHNYSSCVWSFIVVLWFTLWDWVATEGISHHKTFWNPRSCVTQETMTIFILLWLRTTTRQDWVGVWSFSYGDPEPREKKIATFARCWMQNALNPHI